MELFKLIRKNNFYIIRNTLMCSNYKNIINDLHQEQDFDDYKCTILMELCIYVNEKTIKYIEILLEMYDNININKQDEYGINVLMILARSKNSFSIDVINFLIKKFPDIDYLALDKSDYSALMYAKENNNIIYELLLNKIMEL